MNLANRIASKIPVDGIAVTVECDSYIIPGDKVSIDGLEFTANDSLGYNITFKFPSLGIDAVRHTSTLNLSNRAIDKMVADVAVSFRDMIAEINQSGQGDSKNL